MIYTQCILINFSNEAFYQFRLSETSKFSTIQRAKLGDFSGGQRVSLGKQG